MVDSWKMQIINTGQICTSVIAAFDQRDRVDRESPTWFRTETTIVSLSSWLETTAAWRIAITVGRHSRYNQSLGWKLNYILEASVHLPLFAESDVTSSVVIWTDCVKGSVDVVGIPAVRARKREKREYVTE